MSSFVSVGDARLRVADEGAGEPVVLLASLGRSAVADFDALAGELVNAGYRAVRLDGRGVGDDSGSLDGLDLVALAADVAAACGVLGTGPVHVVGHAFGNRVARCLAASHPDAVRSVTLLAAGGMVPPDEEARAALVRSFDLTISDADRLRAVSTAFFAPGGDPAAWSGGWYPSAAVGQRAAVERTRLETWWAAHTAPTLVVQGLADRIAPPANGRRLVEMLRARGIDSRLVELAGAGHALLPEQPMIIAATVSEFLRTTRSDRDVDVASRQRR